MTKTDYALQEPNLALAKKLNLAVYAISFAVLLLVGMMRQIKIPLPEGYHLDFLPAVHAGLNSAVALLLVSALVAIKKGSVPTHKLCINLAMLCSAAFLLCYVAYHFTTPETKYGGEGLSWYVYIILLASHIVLAAVSFPFILYTWVLGYTNQFARHRKFAKYVFPIWLYVAITGPVCYLMLRPYYGS